MAPGLPTVYWAGPVKMGAISPARTSPAAAIQASLRVHTGCSATTKANPGNPAPLAVSLARPLKGVVTTAVDGSPASEQCVASSKLFDVQAPQSPTPLTTRWARAAISARTSLVIG